MPGLTARTFRLISISCTTGWLDWVHGELWLAGDGILRRRRGWLKTIGSGNAMLARDFRRHADDEAPVPNLTDADIDTAVEHGGLWISAPSIREARLRVGLSTGRLGIITVDGSGENCCGPGPMQPAL